MKSNNGAVNKEVPICIVDSHGDALYYWSETHAGQKRTVLHLDSHADMMTNWSNQLWTQAGPDWTPPSKESLVHRVANQVDLANFQPSAVLQGFIDSIVWLRSDFSLGNYNGPPPGHYRRTLAMPDYSVPGTKPDPIIGDGARPLVATFHVAGESFAEYGDYLVHESRTEIQQMRRASIPAERNTLWDPSWECTRPPVQKLSFPFDHSVVTLEQLLAAGGQVLEEVSSDRLRLSKGMDGADWILDIDLDYFATYSPLLAFIIRKHNWLQQADAEAFASWAVPFGEMCSKGLEEAARHTLFSPACQPFTVREVVRLPFTQDGRPAFPSAADIRSKFRKIHQECEIPWNIYTGLSRLVNGLTQQQRLQWATLHADDWWWIMQFQGPHHYSTPEEISAHVHKLEQVFRYFPYPPSLVTIARSMDMYMPEGASDIAEWEILLLLRRIWPQDGAHELPHNLQDCREDDVRLLLDKVTFYPTTRPIPGQQVEKMVPRPWPFAAPVLPGRAAAYSAGGASKPNSCLPAQAKMQLLGNTCVSGYGASGAQPLAPTVFEVVDYEVVD
mmetsp:Transcript_70929/g.122950  ORF Transcript_70929/g.122950 Transcript_70929/m.122950 type:complete len:558 (+) Transcript_70929:69-1742(+)